MFTTSRLVDVPIVVVIPPAIVAKPTGIKMRDGDDIRLMGDADQYRQDNDDEWRIVDKTAECRSDQQRHQQCDARIPTPYAHQEVADRSKSTAYLDTLRKHQQQCDRDDNLIAEATEQADASKRSAVDLQTETVRKALRVWPVQ